ncbi:MAG: CAP domain-containing protein, partial [Conexibacter sp.]
MAPASADDETGSALLRELNRVRAAAHLAPLRLDGRMSDGATAYAQKMGRTRRIGHGAWSARIARSASSPARAGEVIGWLTVGAPEAEASWVVRTWLASPVHRRVVLDGSFRRIGIGRATSALG